MTEFNKKILFEMYKDKAMRGRSRFKVEMMKRHDLSEQEARNLYDTIINYQIKKYNEQVNYTDTIKATFNKNFKSSYRSHRRSRIESMQRNREEQKILERIYEDK